MVTAQLPMCGLNIRLFICARGKESKRIIDVIHHDKKLKVLVKGTRIMQGS